jgi:primase-polymerase (primpol)-like protein
MGANPPPDDTPPVALPVRLDGLPAALTERRQWVAWRFEWVAEAKADAGGRWTKVPVNVHTGGRASSTNPAQWAPFGDALAYADTHGLPGVGFVFAAEDPFCGIDLDTCRDPDTGDLDAWAGAIVADLDSYAELSPSGTGVHVIVAAALPVTSGRRKGRLEMYHAARYFTMTGHRLPEAPATVRRRQGAVDALYAVTFDATEPESPRPDRHRPTAPPADGTGLGDADVVRRAMAARNGAAFAALYVVGDTAPYDDDESRADEALCSLLAFWTRDPGQIDRLVRRSGRYREKWERADYRDRTIRRALDLVTDSYQGGGAPATSRPPTGRRIGAVEFVGGKAVPR